MQDILTIDYVIRRKWMSYDLVLLLDGASYIIATSYHYRTVSEIQKICELGLRRVPYNA